MTTFNLTADCINTVVDTLKAEAGVQKRWLKAADSLRAEGVTVAKLDTDKEFRDAFKTQVILLSFTKTEQSIMAKPATTLSDEEKVTRRWIQQQIGTRLSTVTKYVRRAEEDEALSDEDRGARKVASLETQLKRDLTKWIDKVEKAEAVTFPALKMLTFLKDASALLK